MTGEKQVERREGSAPLFCLLLSSGLMFSSFPPLTFPSKMLSTQHLFRFWALPAPNHSVPFSAVPLSSPCCLLALFSHPFSTNQFIHLQDSALVPLF